jgi:hypothetical protein
MVLLPERSERSGTAPLAVQSDPSAVRTETAPAPAPAIDQKCTPDDDREQAAQRPDAQHGGQCDAA